MKKIITLILAIMMVVSSMGLFACGKGQVQKDQVQAVDNPDVVLVDVAGKTSVDVNEYLSLESISVINKSKDVKYKLISVATGRAFTFDSSNINLSSIHKEYYKVEVYSKKDLIVTAKLDLHDVNNDGVVWCEWSDYILDACVVYASSDKVEFEYVNQSFGSDDVSMIGDALIMKPGKGRDFLNYLAVKPFHSKKYYETYARYGVLSISYVRQAVYSFDNVNFAPDTDPADAGHYDGEFVAPGTVINSKVFGVSENSQLGAKLNMWQSIDCQMIQIVDNFEKIGDKKNGGSFWFLIGTCHYGHPYRISFYISNIEVIPA